MRYWVGGGGGGGGLLLRIKACFMGAVPDGRLRHMESGRLATVEI
jgi:hypothetical protein